MTNGTIAALSLAGGASVLVGYSFLTMTGISRKLYSYFTPSEKQVFLILTFLSIISFFYLFYWASFRDSLGGWQEKLLDT